MCGWHTSLLNRLRHHQVGNALPAVAAARPTQGRRRMASGGDGLEYPADGGAGGTTACFRHSLSSAVPFSHRIAAPLILLDTVLYPKGC